jgi:hypothetical protein
VLKLIIEQLDRDYIAGSQKKVILSTESSGLRKAIFIRVFKNLRENRG